MSASKFSLEGEVTAMGTPTAKIRHCGYCLLEISGDQVKLCGKCNRRAYCSRDCQTKDWKKVGTEGEGGGEPGQRGQGHKNWCLLRCGEEDLDWKVAPVEGKGLGLIALKAFPARSRILVEAAQISPMSHPGIMDLAPNDEGSTLEEKWALNSLSGEETDKEKGVLGLRIARANHSCNPNAMHLYCNTFNVKILFTERDISPGEEICISYQSFKRFAKTKSALMEKVIASIRLWNKWGIRCPKDCLCNDKGIISDVSEAMTLDKAIFSLARRGRVEWAMKEVKKLMKLQDGRLSSSFLDKKRSLYEGFEVGVLKKGTLAQGLMYMKKLLEIMGDIFHPQSAVIQEYKGYLNNPVSHSNYLALQK